MAGDHLCIVMELADSGDLASYMEQMSFLSVRSLSQTMQDHGHLFAPHDLAFCGAAVLHVDRDKTTLNAILRRSPAWQRRRRDIFFSRH